MSNIEPEDIPEIPVSRDQLLGQLLTELRTLRKEIKEHYPSRDDLAETLDVIDAAGKKKRRWGWLLILLFIVASMWFLDEHTERCVVHGPKTSWEQRICNIVFPLHNHDFVNIEQNDRRLDQLEGRVGSIDKKNPVEGPNAPRTTTTTRRTGTSPTVGGATNPGSQGPQGPQGPPGPPGGQGPSGSSQTTHPTTSSTTTTTTQPGQEVCVPMVEVCIQRR